MGKTYRGNNKQKKYSNKKDNLLNLGIYNNDFVEEKLLLENNNINGLIELIEKRILLGKNSEKNYFKLTRLLLADIKNIFKAKDFLEDYLYDYLCAKANNLYRVNSYEHCDERIEKYAARKSFYIYELAKIYSFLDYQDKSIELLKDIQCRGLYNSYLIYTLCKENKFDMAHDLQKDYIFNEGFKSLSDMELTRGNYNLSLKIIDEKIKDKDLYYQSLMQYHLVKGNEFKLSKYLQNNKKDIHPNSYKMYKEIRDIVFLGKYNDSDLSDIYQNYNIERVMEHIKKHYKEDNSKYLHSVFNENFVIEDRFTELQNLIGEINPIQIKGLKKYFVKTDEIVGSLWGIDTNNLMIVSTLDDRIVWMYPTISHSTIHNNSQHYKIKKIINLS